jgi:hypothetical protein
MKSPVNMTYELLKIKPFSDADGNVGWEDFDSIDEFAATPQSLRRWFAVELKKRGVCISRREHKFEFYGENNENIELVDSETDLPLFAAVSQSKL